MVFRGLVYCPLFFAKPPASSQQPPSTNNAGDTTHRGCFYLVQSRLKEVDSRVVSAGLFTVRCSSRSCPLQISTQRQQTTTLET